VGIGNTVFVTTMFEGVAALKADTGDILWHAKDMPKCDPLWVLGDEKAPELYGASEKGFVRFDPETGNALWTSEMRRDSATHLYPFEGKLVIQMSDQAWVLNKEDGAKVWGAATWHQQSAYAPGRVILRGDKGGDIYCYSVAEGSYTWHNPCPGNNLARLFVGGDVVVAINLFEIEAYDVAKGTTLWHKTASMMQPFETSTWASNDKAIFYRCSDWVFGCDPRNGSWVTSVPGKFFFVHWMWTRGDAVVMHCGSPGAATVGAIIVKARQKGAGG
jgi:outer membrane protein assembly factor BamB